ncbi:MAG TPA: hypothetical protein VFA16_10330 [Mycobacterium sp.]|uniref:hypothetical protein n=1 Tax=Mycobacterium sp. TaxID=1785 RepID=UPI002D3716AF|nr:hypothetical protein [Mycobacterium sp.]HZU47627.1 hypothetical protein [Mycobacterium sp.]
MKRLLMMCALVVAASTPMPVGATSTTSGEGLVEGTVDLTQGFPCSCALGAFNGTVALTLSGISTFTLDGAPEPYTAVWTGTGNTVANFGYTETCLNEQPDNTPPLLGSANGTFTISGGLLDLGTNVYSVSLTGVFTYQRIGTGVRMVFTQLAISNGSTIATNLDNFTLVGQSADAIAFVPPVGTCVDQVVPQLATLAGMALQVV